MTTLAIDFSAIKARQQGAWSTGNYAEVGTTLQIVGESLCEALDLRAGARVLDVAAGNGNATLAAARRFGDVVSTDYVPALLEAGRRRAAAELVRVCAPGGRIGLANWTPEGFIGKLFKTIGRYVPPPPGVKPPSLWGTEARLAELFGGAASAIRVERREFVFRYRSPLHWVDHFRTWYGPMNRTFAALDAEHQAAFTRDLFDLMAQDNRSGDGTLVLPSEYLEVVIEKRR